MSIFFSIFINCNIITLSKFFIYLLNHWLINDISDFAEKKNITYVTVQTILLIFLSLLGFLDKMLLEDAQNHLEELAR